MSSYYLRLAAVVYTLTVSIFASSAEVSSESTRAEESLEVEAPTDKTFCSIAPNKLAPGFNLGMWVWQKKYVVDTWERILMLDFCYSHGIGTIFVQVQLTTTPEGDYQMANPLEWQELLLVANELGISVEALDGASYMAFELNRTETFDRLQAVLDFNRSQPLDARFSGIHYDIEPYTSSRWLEGDHQGVAIELLDILSDLKAKIYEEDPSLTFANDIPFWYDDGEDYRLEYNGVLKYLNQHIQDISDYVGIMSYRVNADGKNSIVDVGSGEMAYGTGIGKPVYLSIETVELPETPKITFYGKNVADVVSAIRSITGNMKRVESFGGVLLHEYKSILLIDDEWDLSAINKER